jgi:exodeoxyribonuclease-3
MRVISVNVNGLRSAARKGFFDWLPKQNADVICVQETRAPLDLLESQAFQISGYHSAFHVAEKGGYSGVGIYSRLKPLKQEVGLGWPCADNEGRFIQFDFENVNVASIYFPSGSSSQERQIYKEEFMQRFTPKLIEWSKEKKPFILCGDFNIVHKEIDIKNFYQNQKSSGCLPHERAWLDTLFEKMGLVDAFRVVDLRPDQYTWWSNRRRAWDNNVGWRIDYQVVSSQLKPKIQSALIYKEQRFSDHAPLIVDYDLP